MSKATEAPERDVDERCVLCDAPWDDDHPQHCKEWPDEDLR